MKIHCSYDKLVPLDKIKPHPKNRNKHTSQQIQRLAEIFKYQGIRKAVVVSNLSGFMTAGHGRLEAAKLAGMKVYPVNFQDYDDEAQEYADLTADNAIALWAEIDLSGVNADIGDLGPDFSFDMLGIKGFTLDVSERGNGKDADAVPEVPKKAKAKLGEIYQLGDHRLMCGDSTNPEHIGLLMNGEKAKLWSSDPPYGINHVEVANEKGQAKGYTKIQNDELQDEALREFLFKVITGSLPHMEKSFAFYMWHAMKMQAYFSQAAAAAGILFHRQIIWKKPQFVFGRGHYHWRHELCLMGWLKGDEPPFYGQRNQDTVWEIDRENDKIHPTQKPVEIFARPIRNHLKRGEIVYEPFSGSGSNFIAAEQEKVRCFGLELEPVYIDVIIKRWENYTGKKSSLVQAGIPAARKREKK